MIELIYPAFPAPVLKGSPAGKASEMLPVVEPSGQVVGQAERGMCHDGRKLLHPVVHLHIIDRNGRLYIQHRSEAKDLFPGRWDTAVGGHVSYGEYYQEALFREAGEELGFFDFNPVYLMNYIHESATEKELVNIYAAVGSFDLRPDNDEVSEGRWWTAEEIAANIGKSVFTPNFEDEYGRIKDTLAALL